MNDLSEAFVGRESDVSSRSRYFRFPREQSRNEALALAAAARDEGTVQSVFGLCSMRPSLSLSLAREGQGDGMTRELGESSHSNWGHLCRLAPKQQ